MTYRLEVVGNPIAHSLSPMIHQAFAQQFGRDIDYVKQEVALDGFHAHAEQFLAAGGYGMNVTVPFKQDAFAFVTQHSPAAQLAGAVNTICVTDGVPFGHNTDGIGLINDLAQRWQLPLKGKTVLLLGAGGSTRGLLEPLVQAGVGRLLIANRTLAKANELIHMLADRIPATALALPVSQPALTALGIDGQIDVVINTTSIGLQPATELTALIEPPVLAGTFCYDLSYGANARFAQLAAPAARRSVDGLGMLVEQAAVSYHLWFAEQPQTEPVYQALLDHV